MWRITFTAANGMNTRTVARTNKEPSIGRNTNISNKKQGLSPCFYRFINLKSRTTDSVTGCNKLNLCRNHLIDLQTDRNTSTEPYIDPSIPLHRQWHP